MTSTSGTGALQRLELAGEFPHPHWLAFLCSGLSAAGLSVVSGTAVRLAPLRWDGHLEVAGDVSGVDVAALAARRPEVRDAAPPVLTSYVLRPLRDGQLEVRLSAPDELGFLGRFLSRVSLLTLLPSEVTVATVGGRVDDRVVLSGIGSATPGPEVVAALDELLGRLVR